MKIKAGGFPFYIKSGTLYVCLFKSNNDYYGGDKPQMSKGHIDEGESPLDAALRECHEELGIEKQWLENDAIFVDDFHFIGEVEDYTQAVFGFNVQCEKEVQIGTEGTGVWMEYAEAVKEIRTTQLPFLIQLGEIVR